MTANLHSEISLLKLLYIEAWNQQQHATCALIIHLLVDLGAIKPANCPYPQDDDQQDYDEEQTGEMR